METTLTLSQNSALYFAHAYSGETVRQRAALFRKFAAAASLQSFDNGRQTFADPDIPTKRFAGSELYGGRPRGFASRSREAGDSVLVKTEISHQ